MNEFENFGDTKKVNIADYIEKNTVDKSDMIKDTILKIFRLEKQKREINSQIKEIKDNLSDHGINKSDFTKTLSVLRKELKMSADQIISNAKMYNVVATDEELLHKLKQELID